eukprot:m.486553 g.486553  ORF g.486553 m.486553 type:complete len:405 (+) comp57215_c0_seq16:64-1278(+)
MLVALTAVLCVVLLSASGQTPDMTLVKLPPSSVESGAVCLDGTPLSYYLRQNTSSTQWVLFFQGGAWCYDLESCYQRSLTRLGSSNFNGPNLLSVGIFSNNITVNPDFYTWNAVYLLYCDGASWTGNVDEPVEYNNSLVYFRGKRNLDAVLANLTGFGLGDATEIMIGGCSAGGLSSIIHGDYIAAQFPNARAAITPVSGFFLNASNPIGQYAYASKITGTYLLQNSSAGVHQGCLAAHPHNGQLCIMAENTYPYITTPIFISNSVYDTYQIPCILLGNEAGDCAAFNWGSCLSNIATCSQEQITALNNFRSLFLSKISSIPTYHLPTSGVFLDSCYGHCETQPWPSIGSEYEGMLEDWSPMLINGVDATHAIGNWYFNRTTTGNDYVDCEWTLTAPFACNPTC